MGRARGDGRPSNFLLDYPSNSSNSGVNIGGRGTGKADDLGSSNVYECRFLQPFYFNCIFTRSVLTQIISRCEVLRMLHVCISHQHSL